MNALKTLASGIDLANDWIGRGVSWLTLAMVLITFVVVVLRYVFNIGFVWLQESYVWLHGVVFMVGAGYTLLHEGHVRVDIIYRTASPRYRAWVDLGGALLLLGPMVAMVWIVAWPYVLTSWERLEASREAGGLPGLFMLKSVLLVFCVCVGGQALSMIARALLVLFGADGEPDRKASGGQS
jgi:TRAP-type mannitol/chloroaromatic compound transport system permease small subunit